MSTLKFSLANGKLQKLAKALNIPKAHVFAFNMPSGYSCPNANECLSKSDRETGKLTDGKNMKFRCFAASLEAIYPSLRKRIWENFDAVKEGVKDRNLTAVLQTALPKKAKVVRIHASGDFYSDSYFNAFNELAVQNPNVVFYAYTKMLKYVQAERPDNFRMVYSIGGKDDKAFVGTGLPYSKVIFDASQADADIDIDDNDIHAYNGVSSNLIIHGNQPREINLKVKALKNK
jgi:hypothetical protein